MFVLDDEQKSVFAEWNEDHKCGLKEDSGTIGGRLTYQFIPTGLGLITKVICCCGEEIDLTEYADW